MDAESKVLQETLGGIVCLKRMDDFFIKEFTKIRFNSDDINKSLDKTEREINVKISEKEREELIEFAKGGNYNIKTNNTSHLEIIKEMQSFRNLFYGKKWTIYISKSNKKFITSDNPVTELFPEWTGRFVYGPTFLQRIHYFSNMLVLELNFYQIKYL